MKRFIVSGVILLIIVSVSIIGLYYINENYERITSAIEAGEESVRQKDFDAAQGHIKRAEDIYVKAEKYLSAFVNHSTLDEIGVSIAAITPFAKGEEEEFLSHCEAAKTALKHLKNDMAISVRNLF